MSVIVQGLLNLGRHSRRTAFNLAVIAAASAAMLLTLGFMRHSFRGLGEAIVNGGLGHLAIAPASEAVTTLPSAPSIEDAAELASIARAVPGVVEASPVTRFSGLLTAGDRSLPVLGEASDPVRDRASGQVQRLLSGTWLADEPPGEGEDAVVLGAELARGLGVEVGDPVTLLALGASGTLDALDVTVVGTTTSGLQELDARWARLHPVSASRLLGSESVSALVIALEDGSEASVLRARDELAARVALARPDGGLAVATWQERAPFYQQVRDLYAGIFAFLGLVILTVTCLASSSSLMMTVTERTREFGTLRAMGAGDGVIAGLIASEAVWLGLIGSALGSFIGTAIALAVNASGITMPPPPGAASRIDLRLEPSGGDHVLAAGILLTALLLAAALPTWHVLRLRISEALARH